MRASSLGCTLLAATAAAGPLRRAGQTAFAGINIAGFDFGCDVNGACTNSGPAAAANAAAQMQHFATKDKLNLFRLPVGWQFLVAHQLGGPLDPALFGAYDAQVQACLATGAHCIIDVHNYARWDGGIIGQGGPTDEQFANLWGQLAGRYANTSQVVFGVMNEPHDVPDIRRWATTVQAAVTAIRQAGAATQMVLLPGNDWTSAGGFVPAGSLAALQEVKNPDGSTDNLIFDVHQYLDNGAGGKDRECYTDEVANAFQPLADALRSAGRKAMLTETGGGNTESCFKWVCSMLNFLNDVYLGYTTWAAGGFAPDYELVETPIDDGQGGLTDQPLVQKCISRGG